MRKHNGVRLDGGHSALAALARRAASACMAVATVVGVVEATPVWAEESAEFPQTMHFAVSMANMNLSENDLPAFRYGFSGFREANPTVPVYTNSQFEEAQAYFRGNAAYCMDVDKGSGRPLGRRAEYGDGGRAGHGVPHVQIHHPSQHGGIPQGRCSADRCRGVDRGEGYPNVESQSVFAKNLDDVDARSVTQLAIWIASGQVRVEGGEDSSKATKAVSVANPGHQVAGAGYSSGGQQNFAPTP